MTRAMRESGHIYNYTDKKGIYDTLSFRAKTETLNQAATNSRWGYAQGVTRQKIQEMWQNQLPLCRRPRSRKLLSFCQYVWPKPYHALCFPQKPKLGQKSFGKLPSCSKDSGRHQHHQPRSTCPKGNIVKERLCLWQWKPPP